MEMYAGDYGPDTYNIPTSPLFWGAVIFVALLVVAYLLVVGKRNRRRFDGRPMEKGHTKDPRFDQTLFDQTCGRNLARDRRVSTDRPDPWAAQGHQGTPEGA